MVEAGVEENVAAGKTVWGVVARGLEGSTKDKSARPTTKKRAGKAVAVGSTACESSVFVNETPSRNDTSSPTVKSAARRTPAMPTVCDGGVATKSVAGMAKGRKHSLRLSAGREETESTAVCLQDRPRQGALSARAVDAEASTGLQAPQGDLPAVSEATRPTLSQSEVIRQPQSEEMVRPRGREERTSPADEEGEWHVVKRSRRHPVDKPRRSPGLSQRPVNENISRSTDSATTVAAAGRADSSAVSAVGVAPGPLGGSRPGARGSLREKRNVCTPTRAEGGSFQIEIKTDLGSPTETAPHRNASDTRSRAASPLGGVGEHLSSSYAGAVAASVAVEPRMKFSPLAANVRRPNASDTRPRAASSLRGGQRRSSTWDAEVAQRRMGTPYDAPPTASVVAQILMTTTRVNAPRTPDSAKGETRGASRSPSTAPPRKQSATVITGGGALGAVGVSPVASGGVRPGSRSLHHKKRNLTLRPPTVHKNSPGWSGTRQGSPTAPARRRNDSDTRPRAASPLSGGQRRFPTCVTAAAQRRVGMPSDASLAASVVAHSLTTTTRANAPCTPDSAKGEKRGASRSPSTAPPCKQSVTTSSGHEGV